MVREIKSEEVKPIIEALIFVSDEPLGLDKISSILKGVDKSSLKTAIYELKDDYKKNGKGIHIIEVANGFKMCTRGEYSEWVSKFFTENVRARISKQAMETLAIIAYKQPATKAEIEQIRGVNTIGVLKTLLDRKLVKILGKKEVAGRPMMYGTTREFLELFGLRDLSELPGLKEFSELGLEEIEDEKQKAGAPPEGDFTGRDSIQEGSGENDPGGKSNA